MSNYKYKRILFLSPPKFTGGLESIITKQIAAKGLKPANIQIRCFTTGCLKKLNKTKYTWDQSKYPQFIAKIKKFNPDFIICNDKAALGYITQKYISLALTRGSIYKFEQFNNIPVLILDDVTKTRTTSTGKWILSEDFKKLARWLTGTQRYQPRFSYKVCESLDALQQLSTVAKNSIFISVDIETSGIGKWAKITCVGYSCLQKDGSIFTGVIPFVDTTKSDGNFWREEQLHIHALLTMRDINANSVPKTLQNGTYDSSHFLTYRFPLNNYIADSQHLWHSIYCEAPKRLDFITSMCQDFYRYWKDESKEDEKDDNNDTQVPQTVDGLRYYWRYNALDCYYTLVDTVYLLFITYGSPNMYWAKENYIKEFSYQTGFGLAGSMRGIIVNRKIQSVLSAELLTKSTKALNDLKTMLDDPEFNPGSAPQIKKLIYTTLKAREIPRQKGKTGEEVLKLIQTQHPLYKRIINTIWDYKKPLNNYTKYGKVKLINDRFMYKISCGGTETMRQATSSSNFWTGSNVQNIPEPMRIMMEADPDYYLFDFDYSQSDAWFSAFESEDPKYIDTMLSPKDTHLIHAEHFFQIPFDKLQEGKDKKESWCVHKVEGVRSVTKRVVYGSNYLMTGYTLFITMGLEAVVAAAKHLGFSDADSWDYKKLIFLCQQLIDSYFELYNVLPGWLQEEITKAMQNYNLVSCYGGFTRLFFKDLRNDKSGQRELASFFGQGGTAGNINAFLKDFYYGESGRLRDCSDIMFLFQVHDSVVGQVRKDKLHLLIELKDMMQRECEIHGRTFTVPVEGQVGIGWGKRMVDWHPNVTAQEIEQHEQAWWKKFSSRI